MRGVIAVNPAKKTFGNTQEKITKNRDLKGVLKVYLKVLIFLRFLYANIQINEYFNFIYDKPFS